MIKKHFDRLGIKQGATKDNIKKAYRRRAMLFHPDRNDSPTAEQKFIELNLSYEILMDYKEGGAPTYQTTNNTNYKKTTYYKNTRFTVEEVEAAWARLREKERKEYEYFLSLEWHHPAKIAAFFDTYGVAIGVGIVSLILSFMGIMFIIYGIYAEKDGESMIIAGIGVIIVCLIFSFGIIKALRETVLK